MRRDVVVTGLGAVTPIGATADDSWDALLAGKSGAGPITRFDPDEADCRSKIACEATLPEETPIGSDKVGRYAELGITAAGEAIADAGFDPNDPGWEAERVGTSVATSIGGLPEIEDTVGQRPSSKFTLTYLSNLTSSQISILFDAAGPNRAASTACAAGAHAVGDAMREIESGRADVMISGGAESILSPYGVRGFDAMRALSTRNDEPERASRPFDVDRDGFVIGEGGAALVLESREHALERGVEPIATVEGTARSADSMHPTRPPEDADGLIRCIERGLTDAAVAPTAVDHVNAHATSTPRGDEHEATALNQIFDSVPPVTGTKGLTGHTLGASGAIESVFTVKTLQEQTIPPTANYESPDPDCDVPVVDETRSATVDVALNIAAGFGGTNGVVVFGAAR
ncbi:beta-ketoacyl-[acyl-carrier-protein] synthase family protein [Haloarcula salinisoli]|uniref:Beta-ketoacyl-[acyl-carrier-protein] synthase family protein n=1 Tax=Haloarcula salinisoli TaxID=2487746 RepID=A0A8J7YRN1_9EURY|nr:beta-ketoacyl-[acyl-carrier-protein] synthase family protein [Halomicroarcula salinisoli]MBX0288654.1 beta-ketoacyl-[acyl-carrier-protein] synthase family protein [Halomicroarcula salinisoli]MBX0306053.1 beta-ketoacyl-[acyl-carrier-protein] synthase family protein [Halomicroarcula salinisoli]